MKACVGLTSLLSGLIVASSAFLASTSPSLADSCWTHNGSVMRLVANGQNRAFYYERPRRVLQRAGVTPGTLLFDGVRSGNSYHGTARVFSRHCPGSPLSYQVSGRVSGNDLRVTLQGTREINNRCQRTGRYKTDVLVFNYSHQC